MKGIARVLMILLLVELVALARARAPFAAWLPDFSIALVACVAMLGRREIVVPAAALLAALRVPASLAEPLSACGAVVGFAWLALATRRFVFRDNPAVLAAAGVLASLFAAAAAVFADRARGFETPAWTPQLECAVTTGMLTMFLSPSLRAFPWTARLLERRFGDS